MNETLILRKTTSLRKLLSNFLPPYISAPILENKNKTTTTMDSQQRWAVHSSLTSFSSSELTIPSVGALQDTKTNQPWTLPHQSLLSQGHPVHNPNWDELGDPLIPYLSPWIKLKSKQINKTKTKTRHTKPNRRESGKWP